MKTQDSGSHRNVYRLGVMLIGLASLQACGAISALEHQGQQGNNQASSNEPPSHSTGSTGTSTDAVTLSNTAAQMQSPQMNTYLAACSQTPACANDANQVGQLIGQAVALMGEGKDATQVLQQFDQALQTLVTCMQKNATSGGNVPAPPTIEPNNTGSTRCTTQQSQGVVVTTCDTNTTHCVTRQQPNGEVVQTCVCGGSADGGTTGSVTAGTTGSTPVNPSPMPGQNPNNPSAPSTTGGISPTTGGTSAGSATHGASTGGGTTMDPQPVTTGGNGTATVTTGGGSMGTVSGGTVTGGAASTTSTTTGGGGSTTGGVSVSEQCSTQKLPDGSISVTCTCNALNGSCSVQGSAP